MELYNYLSELDSQRFGFKIAKVNDFKKEPEEIINFLKHNDVKLILSKISTENLQLINKLEVLDFTVKDIQVTYKYDLMKQSLKEKIYNNDLIIRHASESDIPFLKSIALNSFLNYGHYANDNKLDKIKSSEIYGDWISRSILDTQVADKVFIAEYKGEIAGFLTFKIFEKDNLKFAAGGLGAVDQKFRSLNLFSTLTLEGLHWGKKIGLDWQEHNVLINNYPVNKSFVKSGFTIYKSFITLHHWIK